MRQALLIGVTTLALAAGLAGFTGSSRAASKEPAAKESTLTNAAGSRQELIDRLLAALHAKDVDALRRLRLTETEYLEIVIPGNVEPGQPRRDLGETWKTYAWANLSTRSNAYERELVQAFGGKDLVVKAVSFEEGEKQYAGYRAHRQTRLTVIDADGTERELRTGSIAEIDGKFKFISFIRD